MSVEKKLDQLEWELKLIKNEVKQGLVGVHDFLLSMKMPAGNMENMGPDEESLMNLGGGLEMANKRNLPPVLPAVDSENEARGQERVKADPPKPGAPQRATSQAPPQHQPEPQPVTQQWIETPQARQEPEQPSSAMAGYPVKNFALPSQEPQVNMLANLIGWVSLAKQKLGAEHLPVVLEVYGMCGNLTPRTRKIILRLAEIVTQPPEEESGPDVWSQLVLQLHGILSGNISVDSTFLAGESKRNGVEHKEEKDADTGANHNGSGNNGKSLRLKLVLPAGDGMEKELSLGEFDMGKTAKN